MVEIWQTDGEKLTQKINNRILNNNGDWAQLARQNLDRLFYEQMTSNDDVIIKKISMYVLQLNSLQKIYFGMAPFCNDPRKIQV